MRVFLPLWTTSSRSPREAPTTTTICGWPAFPATLGRVLEWGSSVGASGTMEAPIRGHLKAGYRALNPRMRVRALPPEPVSNSTQKCGKLIAWHRIQNLRSSTSLHEVTFLLACKLHSLHTPLSSTRCVSPMKPSGGSKTPTTSSVCLHQTLSLLSPYCYVSDLCNTASRSENRTLTMNSPASPAVPSMMLGVFSVHCPSLCGRWCTESQSCTGSVVWSNAGHSTCLIGGSNPSPCSMPRSGSKLAGAPSPCSTTAETADSTSEDERSNRSGGANVKSALRPCGRVGRCSNGTHTAKLQ